MPHLTRRQFMAATTTMLAGTALAASAEPAVSPAKRPPNIIFILADDLGYGDLGCYGQTQIKTPCLDQFAAEGVRFTQCYSGNTVCAPSRCCLMTGLHGGHSRIRGNAAQPLLPEDATVAELLKKAGYATALIGKWGLGEAETTGVPTKKGFDYFYGFLNQNHAHNHYPDFLWRNETKTPVEGNVIDPDHKGASIQKKHYANDLFTDEAVDYITQHKAEPFFLYLAYTVPHANNEHVPVDGNGMEAPELGDYAKESWPAPQKGHAAMITRLDSYVGRVVETLKKQGIDDDTLVFFASDNGTHKEGGADPAFFKSSGPLRGYKRDLYDGGIRVPMMVRWNNHIPGGKTSDQVWAFWDFMPTALDFAKAPAPAVTAGISMLPVIMHQEPQDHPPLYWEFHEGGFFQAARMGQWKGVIKKHAPIEVYDLSKDVGEANNIADQQPDIARKLTEFIKGARTYSKEWLEK